MTLTEEELVEALPDAHRRDYVAVEVEGVDPHDHADDVGVDSTLVYKNVSRAKQRLDEWREQTRDLELPGHLHFEEGRLRCRVCNSQITIGSERVEYGHARKPWHSEAIDRRCPHRPESVDPKRPDITERGESNRVRGPDGRFTAVATDGGEQA